VEQQHLIAIGGSTGAIQVLRDVLGRLPGDLAAPVLVTVHVGAHGRDLLAAILDGEASLAVTTASEGEKALPGRVYVAPADRHLLVIDGVLRLGRGPRENLSRPAIDAMFRSVAANSGSGAIGLLLTGRLNDGASGLAAIKQCGGTTAVQDPHDSEEPEMPMGGLRASEVDFRAPVPGLADLLVHLASRSLGPPIVVPDALALEVEIALGRPSDAAMMSKIGVPVPLSCPSCGGVLSQVPGPPLRFRCQIGHGFTGEVLDHEQDCRLKGAIGAALRIVDERVTLIDRMAEDARQAGRTGSQEDYQERALELRTQSETLRTALIGLRTGSGAG
jgi:two-component system, chemotaxis family, protein-glutamate methylesterase/glutaminase